MRYTQRSVFGFGVLCGLVAPLLFALVILAGVGVQTLRDERGPDAYTQTCGTGLFACY